MPLLCGWALCCGAGVTVVAIDAPAPGGGRRLGFLDGEAAVPEGFDTMGAEAIGRFWTG